MAKREYRSRKDLNSRETLAYEYMLDGLSLKRIAKSTGYQWKTLKRFKSLWFNEEKTQDWRNFNYDKGCILYYKKYQRRNFVGIT